jgi:acyl dehydratase
MSDLPATLPTFRTAGPIDGTRMRFFARALRDPNPLHVSDEFARSLGMPGRVAQGSMTVAMVGYAVARVVGQENVLGLEVRLRGPLFEHRRVRVDGRLVDGTERPTYRCEARTDRDELLAEASVTVRQP